MSTISQQLAGRTIAEVWRNGACLLIRCTDGFDITIGWRHPETGEPVPGEPVVLGCGVHIVAKPAEILHRRAIGL